MSILKKNTLRLKAHFRRNFVGKTISHQLLFRKLTRENKEQRANMEMWENYLNFTRLDF